MALDRREAVVQQILSTVHDETTTTAPFGQCVRTLLQWCSHGRLARSVDDLTAPNIIVATFTTLAMGPPEYTMYKVGY